MSVDTDQTQDEKISKVSWNAYKYIHFQITVYMVKQLKFQQKFNRIYKIMYHRPYL